MQVPCERLDAREHHAGVRLLLPAVVQAEVRVRLDPPEHVEGLAQDLLAVGDEQHAAELRPGGVERREPRLAQPGRHHDQAAAEAVQPGLFQAPSSASRCTGRGAGGVAGGSGTTPAVCVAGRQRLAVVRQQRRG